jgi:hypothetical protein
MSNLLKIGGASMFCGAILMFGRMAPIFANLPEELESFPPVGSEQLVILARGVGPLWQLAHGLFTIAMLIDGWGVTGAIAAWDAGIGSFVAIEQTHAQAVFLYTWGNSLSLLLWLRWAH